MKREIEAGLYLSLNSRNLHIKDKREISQTRTLSKISKDLPKLIQIFSITLKIWRYY